MLHPVSHSEGLYVLQPVSHTEGLYVLQPVSQGAAAGRGRPLCAAACAAAGRGRPLCAAACLLKHCSRTRKAAMCCSLPLKVLQQDEKGRYVLHSCFSRCCSRTRKAAMCCTLVSQGAAAGRERPLCAAACLLRCCSRTRKAAMCYSLSFKVLQQDEKGRYVLQPVSQGAAAGRERPLCAAACLSRCCSRTRKAAMCCSLSLKVLQQDEEGRYVLQPVSQGAAAGRGRPLCAAACLSRCCSRTRKAAMCCTLVSQGAAAGRGRPLCAAPCLSRISPGSFLKQYQC